MSNFFAKLATVVVGALMSIGLVSSPVPLGSNLPSSPALVDTYLASNIGTTDSSMTLAKGTTNDGISLSGYMCFTLDVNSPQLEYVCGIASGTAVSSMLRGIGFSNPNTTSSALAFTHRRFASVQSTDYPTLQLIVRQLTGVDTLASGTILRYDPGITNALVNSSNQNLATVGFVASSTISGGVPATTANAGIVKLATSTDLANGNTTTTYGMAADSRFFSSSSVTSTNFQVPVAVSGVLANGFVNHTSQTFTSSTFNGTTTFASSTSKLIYATSTGIVSGLGIGTNLSISGGNLVSASAPTSSNGAEAYSWSLRNTSTTSTGVTVSTNGNQKLVIVYAGQGSTGGSGSQPSSAGLSIFIDGASVVSQTCYGIQAGAAEGYGCSAAFISSVLSNATHTVQAHFADVSSAGSATLSGSALGVIYAITVQ